MRIIYCLKKSKKVKEKKRKSRIYKIIQSRTQTQDKIATDIIIIDIFIRIHIY